MQQYTPEIDALDLSSVMARLKRDHDFSAEDLHLAETQYRQFLQLCLDDTGSVPTEAADKVWHYHILDTHKYAADCDAIFGEFMHHNPHDEMTQALETAAQKTQKAWADKFGATQKPTAMCQRSAMCHR